MSGVSLTGVDGVEIEVVVCVTCGIEMSIVVLLLDNLKVDVDVLPVVMEERRFEFDELSPMTKEVTDMPDSALTCGNSMLLCFGDDKITMGCSEVPV